MRDETAKSETTLCAVWIFLMACTPAIAHDDSDPNAAWFQSLRVPGTGVSCCSNGDVSPTDPYASRRAAGDCFPIEEYHASDTPGGYLVILNGREIDVPPVRVLDRTDNPTGHAVLCVYFAASGPIVRCFVRSAES